MSGLKHIISTIKAIQPDKVDAGTIESLNNMVLLPNFKSLHSLIKDKLSEIEAYTLNLKHKQSIKSAQAALDEKTAKEERHKKAQEIQKRLEEELEKRLSDLPNNPLPDNMTSSQPVFTIRFSTQQILDEMKTPKKPLDK